jgi:hypothetical protein
MSRPTPASADWSGYGQRIVWLSDAPSSDVCLPPTVSRNLKHARVVAEETVAGATMCLQASATQNSRLA